MKTYPPLPNASDLVVTLQGTAVEVDSNATKRKQIEKHLCHKECVLINDNKCFVANSESIEDYESPKI